MLFPPLAGYLTADCPRKLTALAAAVVGVVVAVVEA
jgi:hypothetical protein